MHPHRHPILAVVIGIIMSSQTASALDCSSHQKQYSDLSIDDQREFIGCDMRFDDVTLGSSADVIMSAHGRVVLTNFTTETGTQLEIKTDPNGALFMAGRGSTDGWGHDKFLAGAQTHGWPTLDVGLQDDRTLFHDSTVRADGADTTPEGGFDAAFVAYFGGHGGHNTSSGNVYFGNYGNHVYPAYMLLGNLSNGGTTRYFLLNSCNVFRHGPKWKPSRCSAASGAPYQWPQLFDGGSSDHLNPDECKAKANVYENIGRILGDSMRMACGFSTNSVASSKLPTLFWNELDAGRTVAEAWMFGMRYLGDSNGDGAQLWQVPLCITTGGSNFNTTPLATDTDFVMDSNPPGDYFHIMWREAYGDDLPHDSEGMAMAGGSELIGWNDASVDFAETAVPEELPVVAVEATAPGAVAQLATVEQSETTVQKRSVRLGRTAEADVDQRSGGLRIRGSRQRAPERWQGDGQIDYTSAAWRAIVEWDLAEPDLSPNVSVDILRLQRVRRDQATARDAEIVNSQNGVVVQFHRRLTVDGREFDVVGDGGTIEVRLNNDGSFAEAKKTWRRRALRRKETRVRIKPVEQARAEVQAQLNDTGASVSRWRIGYQEAGSSVTQRELRPVYYFLVESTDESLPARLVEVSAVDTE